MQRYRRSVKACHLEGLEVALNDRGRGGGRRGGSGGDDGGEVGSNRS